jgi:hypothetical protein
MILPITFFIMGVVYLLYAIFTDFRDPDYVKRLELCDRNREERGWSEAYWVRTASKEHVERTYGPALPI